MLTTLAVAATFAVSRTLASAPTDASAWTSCVVKAVGGNADLYTFPTDPEFAAELDIYNLDHVYVPSAIAFPTCVDEVSALVKCALAAGVAVQPLSGGHSFLNFGLGGQNGSLSIHLKYLNSISYDKEAQTVKFGTGNLLGNLTAYLNSVNRQAAYSAIPSIGTGGHFAIGGLGPRSRSLGLASDQIVEAKVVLADGSIVTASATENEDLFFAIRGAGWSFGIVTEFTLATEEVVQSRGASYLIPGNASTLETVLGAWQTLISGNDLSEDFASTVYAYDGFLILVTSFYGSEEEFKQVGVDDIFQGNETHIPVSDFLAVLDKLNLTAVVDLVGEFKSNGLLDVLPSLPSELILQVFSGLQQLAPVIKKRNFPAISQAIQKSNNTALTALTGVLNATTLQSVFTDLAYSGLLDILTNATDFSLLGAVLPNLNLTEILSLVADFGAEGGLLSQIPEGTPISTIFSTLFTSHTPSHFYAKSLKYTNETLMSAGAISDIFSYFKSTNKGSPLWFTVFDLAGGAINSPSQNASAYWHRDALYWLQSYVVNLSGPVSATSKSFLTGLSTLVKNGTSGIDDSAYAGYVDDALTDPETAYWGGNVDKLRTIKSQYDPRNVFRNPQSVQFKAAA